MTSLMAWKECASAALEVLDFGEEECRALHALATQAESLWQDLEPADRVEVVATLQALGAHLDSRLRHVEGKLARCARQRAGVRGYGQLQTCHRGQRLRRRA